MAHAHSHPSLLLNVQVIPVGMTSYSTSSHPSNCVVVSSHPMWGPASQREGCVFAAAIAAAIFFRLRRSSHRKFSSSTSVYPSWMRSLFTPQIFERCSSRYCLVPRAAYTCIHLPHTCPTLAYTF
eukprot:5118109-Prymnesium_polylepis.1